MRKRERELIILPLAAGTPSEAPSPTTTSEAGIAWQYFDERSYISAGALRLGENAYVYVTEGITAGIILIPNSIFPFR